MALTIHLGAHKTASTHLQNSLRMAQGQLRAAGVFYAAPVVLRSPYLPLIPVLLRPECPDWYRPHLVRVLSEARDICPEVLLSDENLLGGINRYNLFGGSGLLYPDAPRRVAETIALAGGGPATLCLAVRDPIRFNLSAFAHLVIRGEEIALDQFLRRRDPARADWVGLVRRLSALPGIARIVVWRYEDYPALRPRILARMLPPALVAQVPDAPPANEGLTQPGYDWFVARALADSKVGLRVLARRARMRFPAADGHAPLRLLPDEDYARSAAGYARQIRQLRHLPGVELLAP
ncbi:hypothetical protein [Paracoccus lutimaris]|uniref:Sulfotransferase family protein n=1 Tax=Paracoccus lutimaris TaxID=1490030 RepID=A0A368Z6L3_9RHOB|nr:hypothetical protein [Paracoccus lutimaris]RCW88090.1 hypothetical protein DFP89_10218 [Paracoccus lutimaris]